MSSSTRAVFSCRSSRLFLLFLLVITFIHHPSTPSLALATPVVIPSAVPTLYTVLSNGTVDKGARQTWPGQTSSQNGTPASRQNATYYNTTSGTNNTDCTNLMQPMDPSCYNKLGVNDYLNAWWVNNSASCSYRNLGFADCYQASLGIEGQQCTTMGPSKCSIPYSWSSLNVSVIEAYVLYSIFAIWQFFFSLYQAIESADVSASGPVGQIVQMINPVKQSVSLGMILQALTAFAPMIAVPSSFSYGIIKDSTVVEAILRQTPAMAHYLNPVGTLDSEFVQWSQISAGLTTVKNTYQSNLSDALNVANTDFGTFIAWAQNGNFIAPESDLQVETTNLTLSMQTYVVGAALTSTNIAITMARDTNPVQLTANGSDYENLVDCKSYDQWGVCNEWWWDNSTNIAYGLTNIAAPGKTYHDILEKLFQKGYTTPEFLFRGAKACQDYIAVKHGNNTPELDINTLTPRCIPNTQVCVWDMDCAMNDVDCMYTGEYGGGNICKPPSDFIVGGCHGDGSGDVPDINVPNSYLGPIVHDPVTGDIFCVS